MAKPNPEGKDVREMAPGHEREEQVRANADHLAQEAEETQAATGQEAIDPSKMGKFDNEIARHYDPATGAIPISGLQRGYRYAWFGCPDQFSTSAAKSIARQAIAVGKRIGYEPVHGSMPEGKEYEGEDCAAGTSMRGWGDTMLYRIREEDARRQEQAINDLDQRSKGTVEQSIVRLGEDLFARRGYGNPGHGDPNDPWLKQRVLKGGRERPVTMTVNFKSMDEMERAIRHGDYEGMPKPGFELRR